MYELVDIGGGIIRQWEGQEIPDDVFRFENRNAMVPYKIGVDGGERVEVPVIDPLGLALEDMTLGLHRRRQYSQPDPR